MYKLFKHAFKDILFSKVFVILLMVLIFISATTFTLFTNTFDSFQNSLTTLKNEGKLHDYVIKENYSLNFTSSKYDIYLEGENQDEKYVAKNATNIANDNKLLISNNVNIVGNNYSVNMKIKNTEGYYEFLENETYSISYTRDNFDSDDEVYTNLQSLINKRIIEDESYYKTIVEKSVSNLYTSKINEIYGSESDDYVLDLKSTKSKSISNESTSRKVVQTSNDDSVNKLVNYGGTTKFTDALTIEQMIAELKYKTGINGWSESDYIVNKLKGYRVVGIRNGTNSAISVIDPSSFQAVISPAFAQANNKKTISPSKILEYHAEGKLQNIINEQELLEREKDKIVWVDESPFFIIGIGTTPDFAFPIIDEKHPLPNVNTEAIVFVNERGYQRMDDAFRDSPTENYISLKFRNNITRKKKDEVLAFINEISRDGGIAYNYNLPINNWPGNIDIITAYNDDNDSVLLTQERVIFLEKTNNTIKLITDMTASILLIFVSVIIVLVFWAMIRDKMKTYATLMALGYSRWKISVVTASTSVLIGAIPSLLGYMVALAMQPLLINMFSGTWTIPVYTSFYSLLSILFTIAFPVILLFLLIFIVAMISLRKSIPELSRGQEEKESFIFNKIYGVFSKVSVKTKYGLSLMFKNTGKIFLIIATSIISMSSLMVSMSSLGVANTAYEKTIRLSNYEFKVDLFSPTSEGEGYELIKKENISNIFMRETYGKPAANLDEPHWHVASAKDVDRLHDPFYLKNKLQTRALLDDDSLPINPWDIAETLMPDNQKNEAQKDYDKFVEIVKNEKPNDLEIGENIINTPLLRKDKFKDLLSLNKINPYVISYRNVIVENNDESYTYIDADFNNNKTSKNYHILGFQEDTKYLNFSTSQINKLKTFNKDGVYPIIINEFMNEKYGLSEGDVISMDLNNHVDRNQKSFIKPKIKFEVVDITDTYNDWSIYTLDTIANGITGIDNLKEGDQFNGIFTGEKDPYIFKTIPLYSPSGLYLGTDTILGDWENIHLNKFINDATIWDHSDIATTTAEFIDVYSRTPYASAFNQIDWKEISKYNFKQTSALSNNLISIVQSVSLSLSILFAVIVTSLIVQYNKKKIASLWALGYRKKEIMGIFLKMYIVPLIIGLISSIFITMIVLSGMRTFIITFGNILIPFSIVWWAPFVALAIVLLIFVVSTISSVSSLSNSKSIKVFTSE